MKLCRFADITPCGINPVAKETIICAGIERNRSNVSFVAVIFMLFICVFSVLCSDIIIAHFLAHCNKTLDFL